MVSEIRHSFHYPTEVLVEPTADACKAVNTEVTIINASDHFLAVKVQSDSFDNFNYHVYSGSSCSMQERYITHSLLG